MSYMAPKRRKPNQGMATPSNTISNNSSNPSNPSDEVQCTGMEHGLHTIVDYQHFRFQCGVHELAGENMRSSCHKCFCYICDVSVSECAHWAWHFLATDAEPDYLVVVGTVHGVCMD